MLCVRVQGLLLLFVDVVDVVFLSPEVWNKRRHGECVGVQGLFHHIPIIEEPFLPLHQILLHAGDVW